MQWHQYVTIVVAVLGAVLGILNTWFSLDRNRLRLRVGAYVAVMIRGGEEIGKTVCVSVTNVSTFPVTITQIGFRSKSSKTHAIMLAPVTSKYERLPVRVEPRDAITLYCEPEAVRGLSDVTAVFASTACGKTVYGPVGDVAEFAAK